jgi:hypothetical protein
MSNLAGDVVQKRLEEFLFLGKEYSDKKINFGNWYEDFFKTGGFPNRKDPSESWVNIHVITGFWTVYIGNIAEGIAEAPEGRTLKKFPAGEFAVVTSEWKPTESEAHASLDEAERRKQMPNGYIDDPSAYVVIEKFYGCPERGHRWERWYPIKKAAA